MPFSFGVMLSVTSSLSLAFQYSCMILIDDKKDFFFGININIATERFLMDSRVNVLEPY